MAKLAYTSILYLIKLFSIVHTVCQDTLYSSAIDTARVLLAVWKIILPLDPFGPAAKQAFA